MFTHLKSITRPNEVQHGTTPSDCDILFWHEADSVCHLRCFVKIVWITLKIILKPPRAIVKVVCVSFKSLPSFRTHISFLIEETLSCQQYVLTDTISTGSTYFTTSLTEEQNPPQQKSTLEPCSLREKNLLIQRSCSTLPLSLEVCCDIWLAFMGRRFSVLWLRDWFSPWK